MTPRYNPGTRFLLKSVFIGFGALCALAGSVLLLSAAMAHARSDTATGIVIAFSGTTPPPAQKGPPPEPSVAPVVVFTAPDGTQSRFTARWHATQPAHALGDRVPIRYMRANPANAWIDSFAESWLLPVVFCGIGATFLMIGLLLPAARSSP